MHIALMTLGSRGDVQPFVNLGRGLRAAGYRVRLVTGRGFGDMAATAGLDYAPIDLDFAALIKDPQVTAALRSPMGLLRFWRQAGELVRHSLDASVEAAAGVDAIVHHPKMIAAPHLAERFGLPLVAATLQPILSPTADFPSPLLPVRQLGRWGNQLSHCLVLRLMATGGYPRVLSAWRAERLHLPPKSRLPTNATMVAGRAVPVLYGYSPALVPRSMDWSDLAHVTGAWFGPVETSWQPPASLARFLAEGPRPVYVGFGSMVTGDAAEKGRMVVAALAKAGLRGIVASGWGGLASEAAPHVYALDEAPHAWLFPRCATVVHHGGAGTTHEGLRWGRPTLACPVFGDQPWWGRRIADLGVGPAPVPPRRLSIDRLAASLVDLVSIRAYADKAGVLGALLRAEDGVGTAVSQIRHILDLPQSRHCIRGDAVS